MMNNLPTIQPFISGNNPAESWKYWRQDFEDYITAVKYDVEPEKTRTALFRHVCGEELKRQYRSMKFEPVKPNPDVTLDQILTGLEQSYAEYNNEIYAAFCFLEIKQREGEAFQQYYTRLTAAVDGCNYGNNTERMLRDKLIHGLSDKPIQERLLRDFARRRTTLKQIVEECKAAEVAKQQVLTMNETSEIATIATRRGQPRSNQIDGQSVKNRGGDNTGYNCRSCGRNHQPRKCPAFGTTCGKCGYRNHWAACCRTGSQRYQKNQQPRQITNAVNIVETEQDNTESIVFLGSITLHQVSESKQTQSDRSWYHTILVNNNKIKFKLDTGAQVNVIPITEFKKWTVPPEINNTKVKIFDYSNNEIPIEGQCRMECHTGNIKASIPFIITKLAASPVLGIEACNQLNLIQKVCQIKPEEQIQIKNMNKIMSNIILEFQDVFQGVGRLEKKVRIHLQEGATPHIAAARKIPIALQPRVKEELQFMIENNIIVKVEEPTDWVSAMVVVDTPKRLRICLDPRPLNRAIKRPHYPIPTTDQLMEKLRGNSMLTLLDAKNGFWHLPLEEESSFLTTFATPWGRFRYLVLPFGLNNGPEEFQRAMEEIYQGEPDINPYFDDLVLASDVHTHPDILRRALTVARKANLKLNPSKIQLAQQQITYLGHRVSSKGITMDPRKMEALTQFPTPTNVIELQRFLGMINYVSKFIPQISKETYSMRQLLKKETEWQWDENTEQAFNRVKCLITEAPLLKFFDENKPTQLSVDASQHGLGAVLMQGGRPVAYGSISLTETQSRYAPIERELMAIIYGLEHFDYYTYGREVEILTDHKPLIGLSERPYDTISPRLQRMLLRLNRYITRLTYVPGKLQTTADALSRAPLRIKYNLGSEEVPISLSVALLVTASTNKWENIREATRKDSILQEVIQQTVSGWPNTKIELGPGARQYWHCRDELHVVENGILCRGQRLIIPKTLYREILNTLHVAHRGIVATKAKAREYFYWPQMNTQIEEMISECIPCQRHQRNNSFEPILDRTIPIRPWQRIATDIFELSGTRFLLMVDYFSKYIEVNTLQDATAPTVINLMKSVFARHGIPEEIVSDQGPPYNAVAVQEFLQQWNIKQTYSSPFYSRANGQAERTIQTVKNTLRKAIESGQDLYTVLLDYRITPIAGSKSPAELLMGRRLRSLLPVLPAKLAPEFDVDIPVSNLKKRQETQQNYGNQHTKPLSQLNNGQSIWYRHVKSEPWRKGTILKKHDQPRTYMIKTDKGKLLTRNRYHIRPCKVTSNKAIDYYDIDQNTRQRDQVSQEEMSHADIEEIPAPDVSQPVPTATVVGTTLRTTRSGRVIRPPEKLKDYMCEM